MPVTRLRLDTGCAVCVCSRWARCVPQVDLTPPTMGDVYHGDRVAAPSNTSACGTTFRVTWDAAEDLETGVTSYYIDVGSSPGSNDIVADHLALGFDLPTTPGDPDVRPTAVVTVARVPDGQL